MTKSTLARRAGALVVLAGLVYGPGAGRASAAKPAPPPPPVPLVVTVEALDSAGNPCRICEDGLGNYENGIDGVTANFDPYGNLIINFNATQSPIVRKLSFDYSDQLSGPPFSPPAALNSYLSTGTHPSGFIQNMAVGTAQCINSNITFTDNDQHQTLYRTHYRRALSSFDVSQTSYLVVTRTGPDTWELEPKAAACNTNAPVAKLFSYYTHGHSEITDHGLYSMTFKMTLARQ
jgi:hypothetical protein